MLANGRLHAAAQRRALWPVVCALLAGCTEAPVPIPARHEALVGIWEQGRFEPGTDRYIYLQVSASGYLSSARLARTGNSTYCKTVAPVPITAIDDRRIDTRVLFFTVSFAIDARPARRDGVWTLTIDGHRLQRRDGRREGFPYTWSCKDGQLERR